MSTLPHPNFLIIGAAKSGTTSVHSYLSQHPEIFMSPLKESEFFINISNSKLVVSGPGKESALSKGVNSLSEYKNLFKGVRDETAIGETTPGYLYHPNVATTIKNYIPDCKIIAILRDPVERAFSHFNMLRRMRIEPCENFIDAIKEEDKRISENWGIGFYYTNRGFYYAQLKRYYDTFQEEKIKVLLFDDLKNRENHFFYEIFDFLGVSNSFVPDTSLKLNTANQNRNEGIGKRVSKKTIIGNFAQLFRREEKLSKISEPSKVDCVQSPRLSLEQRREVLPVFKDDIDSLEKLIRRDLSGWLRS